MKSSFSKPGAAPGKTAAAAAPPKPGPKKVAPPAAPAKKPTASAPSRPTPSKPAAPSRPPPGVRTNLRKEEPPAAEQEEPIEVESEVVTEEVHETETAGRELALPDEDEQQIERSTSSVNMFDAPVGKGVGQVDASDLEMPLLKIAQGSDSPLINDLGFTDGDLVLNNEAILFQEGCEPVELTVLRYQKKFQQQLEYDPSSNVFPKVYDTKEAAMEDGLVPFGGDDVGFVPIMDLIVLIKQPEGVDCSTFLHEFDGVLYSEAMWQIRGSAYKAVARKVLTQERMRLRGGLHHGTFKLELTKVKWKIGSGWAPSLKNGEMNSEEFITFAEAVGSGQLSEG